MRLRGGTETVSRRIPLLANEIYTTGREKNVHGEQETPSKSTKSFISNTKRNASA